MQEVKIKFLKAYNFSYFYLSKYDKIYTKNKNHIFA